MENFVLNLFSDQLSKIILDFHQTNFNANFLSGKGSITNIKLNVGLINEFLNKPPYGTVPFLEFEEITLTALRVEVTSYTNLKKAPIVLVIEEIHAKAREPLEYHVDPAANAQHQKERAAALPRASQKAPAGPQPYGLLHRILDNLSVKIKRINLSFSSLGKFKTRRRSLWTPPTLQVSFENVEWICVTETGNPGTPDQVWAHNQLQANQSRFKKEANNQHRHRSYTIYKRLSMVCHVKLLTSGDETQSADASASVSTLITNTKVDVYLAYTRRLRDAGVTGADLDVLVDNVEIDIDMASRDAPTPGSAAAAGCDLGAFAHMLIGLLHCYYKDRSFVDPLLPRGAEPAHHQCQLFQGFGEADGEAGPGAMEGEEVVLDDYLPAVAIIDDRESSDEGEYEEEPDDQKDVAFLAWKRTQGQGEGEGETSNDGAVVRGEDKNELPSTGGGSTAATPPSDAQELGGDESKDTESTVEDGEKDAAPAKSYERKRKAVIVIASGAQKFEKLSFSLSISRINMKLCLPQSAGTEQRVASKDGGDSDTTHHCVELLLENLVAEAIWPKDTSGEMGGHVQGSIKYFHLLESAYRKDRGSQSGTFGPTPENVLKIAPLLRIGKRTFHGHDAFSLSPSLNADDLANNASKCDAFPLMESRDTTWRRDEQTKGPRALAFKSTISFVDETLTLWSRTNVQHEASMGQLEVVLDSAPLARVTALFSDPSHQNAWFDERWLTGEWHAEIGMDMIDTSRDGFILGDHIQPLPSLISSNRKKAALSSEMRGITAHLDSITVRLPNPMQDVSSFRMADVIFNMEEASILVSSNLPSSFLAGVVAAENASHEFPHDPSDISCVSGVPSTAAGASADQVTFRMQISLVDCSLKILPVQAHALTQDAPGVGNLIAPTNVTMMLSLEHNTDTESSNGTDHADSQSLVLSVLVHQLQSHVELRSIYCALETFKHHAESIVKRDSPADETLTTRPKPADENACAFDSFSIICIHVPDLEVNIWALATEAATTAQAAPKHILLSRVKAQQFELGMEFTSSLAPVHEHTKAAVYKCVIASLAVEICSPTQDAGPTNSTMVEFLSMESKAPGLSQLVDRASEFYFPQEGVNATPKKGFFLRSETEYSPDNPLAAASFASSVDIASPLSVALNAGAIEFFLHVVGESLVEPVFFGSSSQIPLGSALWSTILKLSTLFESPRLEPVDDHTSRVVNSLFRLALHRLLILVPSKDQLEGHGSYHGAFFGDVKVACGEVTDEATNKVAGKHCHGDATWLNEFHLLDEGPAKITAYALRSRHTLISVETGPTSNHQFNTILPESSVNWSLPVGLGGSATAPPFNIFAMKDLSLSLMYMGMPLPSFYFKLYKLSSQNEAGQSTFSLAAARLHHSIGTYHCTINNIMGGMNSEIDRLREAVFNKENERIGALALASSTAAGWVRVGEDLSFSHRIFSSATFWRFWMVLDRSLLILYKNPGAAPSFIIPLRTSSHLRSLSMSSSSNKSTGGSIVSNHMQQQGFAVLDPTERSSFFFVAASDTDYVMWVQAISVILKKEETSTLGTDTASTLDAHENGITESSSKAFSVPLASTDESNTLSAMVQENGVLTSPEEQDEDPFSAFGNSPCAPTEPLQAPKPHPFIPTSEDLPAPEPSVVTASDPSSAHDVAAPTNDIQENISPTSIASLESSDSMEEIEMEEVALCEDPPPQLPPAAPDSQTQQSPADSPMPSVKRSPDIQLPMRERLALAKGKSKFVTSRFGSALKTAKEGVLAAGEIGRDGTKQAKEAPSKGELPKRQGAVGQKIFMLKRNAGTKLAAARSSMQDHQNARAEEPLSSLKTPALSTTSSQDEPAGNKKLAVGEKMTLLKKNVINSLVQEQPSKRVITEDSSESLPMNYSQDELSVNKSSKQELRKKLVANLDQSMSNTMRRLKIDEKMTQFSTAVKSSVKNDPVVRQLTSHSKNSDHSRQRLGTGNETTSVKPIKYDARETFSASSELPLKVKSVSSGELIKSLSESIESLQNIEGSWVVHVEAFKTVDADPLQREITTDEDDTPGENLASLDNSQIKPSADDEVHSQWKYRITTLDIACGTEGIAQTSVERTMSEVLILHSSISEIIAQHLPSTAEVVLQEGFQHTGTTNPIFSKLSPLERLRVCGTLLKRILDQHKSSVGSNNQCEMINRFLSTLLECHMPEEALSITKLFLNICVSESDVPGSHGTSLTNPKHAATEAFSLANDSIIAEKQSISQTYSIDDDLKQAHSSLQNVIMDGYTRAMKERDEALATLATATIIYDNRTMKELGSKSQAGPKMGDSDEYTLNLCNQLGTEINLRTTAEAEIKRLNECLEFERKIAAAKEDELRAELARYKRAACGPI